jgi:hypothetical protein
MRLSRHPRAPVPIIVLSLVLIAAGCGGGSTGTGSKTAKSAGAVAFARCMRGHGITGFLDPTADRDGRMRIAIPAGVDPSSPRYQAAERACHTLMPAGQEHHDPAADATRLAEALAFSVCMRAHGVASFPDPDPAHNGGELKVRLTPAMRPKSPSFLAAMRQCDRLHPPTERSP